MLIRLVIQYVSLQQCVFKTSIFFDLRNLHSSRLGMRKKYYIFIMFFESKFKQKLLLFRFSNQQAIHFPQNLYPELFVRCDTMIIKKNYSIEKNLKQHSSPVSKTFCFIYTEKKDYLN